MADPDLETNNLCPYKSVVLAEIKTTVNLTEVFELCLADARSFLDGSESENELNKSERGRLFQGSKDLSGDRSGDLRHAYLRYRLYKPVSWATEAGIRDVENHLVLFSYRAATRCAAIYASENTIRRKIRESLDDPDKQGLKFLRSISPERLHSAFLGNELNTLWMSGMHRRVPVKADAKVLSGPDLEYALDPIGDQTFYFSAVRSQIEKLEESDNVGLSPKKSRIWTGPTSDWDEYCESISELLGWLNETDQEDPTPIEILANEVDTAEDVDDAYDMVVENPASVPNEEIDEDKRVLLEKWAHEANFEVSPFGDLGFETQVRYDGNQLGTLQIKLDASDSGNVEVSDVQEFESDEISKEDEEKFEVIRDFCSNLRHIKVYYDSGHTLSHGSLFSAKYRDRAFNGWSWQSFGADFDITLEKPEDFPAEDANDLWGEKNSLFYWFFEAWQQESPFWSDRGSQGWLASDDGSMEIADFIHFVPAEDESRPEISLIHIKAASSDSDAREISVSNYEVISAQATKNLRYLDQEFLGEGLDSGITEKVGKYVWHEGNLSDRSDLTDAVESMNSRPELKVVIIQPHVQQSYLQGVRQGNEGGDSNLNRLRQLDLLLHRARQSCRAVGAEFVVVGSGG